MIAEGYGAGLSAFQQQTAGGVAPAGWIARQAVWAEPTVYGVNLTYEY